MNCRPNVHLVDYIRTDPMTVPLASGVVKKSVCLDDADADHDDNDVADYDSMPAGCAMTEGV